MTEKDQREPSLNELCCLTALGNIAYAVRCGRRVQPRFKPDHPDAAKMATIVDSALRWAEMSVQQEMPVDESVKALVDAACAVAEASETTDYSAFAAYHAVRGAVLVAEAPEPIGADAFLEIVAAAFGASRVLLTNAPPWIHVQMVAALRSDLDKLAALGLGNGAEVGQRLDATSAGPLGAIWLSKTPVW